MSLLKNIISNSEKDKVKAKGLKIEVDLTNIDLFKEGASVIHQFCEDERIEESIREEYRAKVLGLCEEVNK